MLAIAWLASAFVYFYLARIHIIRTRRDLTDLPLEFDGFGSYARARADWNQEQSDLKPVVVSWIFAALSFWVLYFLGLKDGKSPPPPTGQILTQAKLERTSR